MLLNIAIGYANVWENWLMASNKKRRIPSAFYRLGLVYLFLNLPNIKHIAYIYNSYLAGMKMNHGESILHSLFMCIDGMYFFPRWPCFDTGAW
jgi:hypothetical protein